MDRTEPDLLALVVCPECRGRLDHSATDCLRCTVCGREYRPGPHGYWDFRTSNEFRDWFRGSPAETERFHTHHADVERRGAIRMVDEYVLPLLYRLGMQPAQTTILSNGCGIGADVQRLREHGYAAWGGDSGSRSDVWPDNGAAPYLLHFDATRLPFSADSFDFIVSEGVVEHVGLSGDFDILGEALDIEALERARARFCAEIVRVLKPGGVALVAAPNRLFPIDFFHGGRNVRGVAMRLHKPTERFLVSDGDLRRWLRHPSIRVQAVSLRHFFDERRLAAHSPLGALLRALWRVSIVALPPRLMNLVGPFVAVLVVKARAG